MASDSKAESPKTDHSDEEMRKFNDEQLKPLLSVLIDISTDITNSNELSSENKLKIKLLQKLIPVFNKMVEAKNDDIEEVLGINLSGQTTEPDLYRTNKPGVFKSGSGIRQIEKPVPRVVETKEQVKERLEQNILLNKFVKQGIEELKKFNDRGWCRVQSTETYFVKSVTKNVFEEPSDESDATETQEAGAGAGAGAGAAVNTNDTQDDKAKGEIADAGDNDVQTRNPSGAVNVDQIVAELLGDSGDDDNDVPELTQLARAGVGAGEVSAS